LGKAKLEELEKRIATLEEAVKALDKGMEGLAFRLDGLDGAITNIMREIDALKSMETGAVDPAALFPDEYAELLDFKVEGGYVIAKPKKFLGSQNFAEIARIVRELGGEYISEGKNSRFKIPLKKEEAKPKEEKPVGSEPTVKDEGLESLVRSAWNAGREYSKGEGRWVFSDDYKRLKEALEKEGKSIVVTVDGNEYRVRLSGEDSRFIGIWPRKKQETSE
jgi:hypothetical protein